MEREIRYATKEKALETVKQDGYALKYASDKLKNDREVVLLSSE